VGWRGDGGTEEAATLAALAILLAATAAHPPAEEIRTLSGRRAAMAPCHSRSDGPSEKIGSRRKTWWPGFVRTSVDGRAGLGRKRVIQRRFNVSVPRACAFQKKHPRFESAPRDDRSSKNQPKRVENDRDKSL
jgi:hypothetical protein